jgi:DAPG hydrolase PhiG domain
MRVTLPPALSVPWDPKPVSSASAGSETLPDGRKRYWVKHDVLKGVTPTMLVWWFRHLEGDVEIEGRLLNRYRVWHPFDHVSARSARDT